MIQAKVRPHLGLASIIYVVLEIKLVLNYDSRN